MERLLGCWQPWWNSILLFRGCISFLCLELLSSVVLIVEQTAALPQEVFLTNKPVLVVLCFIPDFTRVGPKKSLGLLRVPAVVNTKCLCHHGKWWGEEHDVVVGPLNRPSENLGSRSSCGKFTLIKHLLQLLTQSKKWIIIIQYKYNFTCLHNFTSMTKMLLCLANKSRSLLGVSEWCCVLTTRELVTYWRVVNRMKHSSVSSRWFWKSITKWTRENYFAHRQIKLDRII